MLGGPLPWRVSPGLGDKKGPWGVLEERGGALPALPGGRWVLLDLGARLDSGWVPLGSPISKGCSWGTCASCAGTVCVPRPSPPACGVPGLPSWGWGGGLVPGGLPSWQG